MNPIKKFYQTYSDKILDKTLNSPFPLRRYVHLKEYYSILKYVNPNENVLDIGCGEGVLAILAAEKGARITACDISEPNITKAKELAKGKGLENINFLLADAENLPFKDNSFDLVISSHVLEHLPDFQKGLREIKRVTKKKAIIALPTCLNLCAICLLGGDNFWKVSKRTPFAWIIGLGRVILSLHKKGVNQGYAGKKELPHLWRYPWIMQRDLQCFGFKKIHFEASSLCLPYFNFLLPLIKFLDKFKDKLVLRNFGYGSIAVIEKSKR